MADDGLSVDEVTISEDDLKNAQNAATKALKVILSDRDTGGLQKIQRYLQGDMDGPYIPTGADSEYRLLAERSTSNWLIPALNAPAQAMYLEDHRLQGAIETSPAFASAFGRNRLKGRQSDLYRDALSYEQAYVAVVPDERDGPNKGKARIFLMSRLNAVGLWVDPVNDERPSFALYIQKDADPSSNVDGYGLAFDRDHIYDAVFPANDTNKVNLTNARAHGLLDCPVIAFTPYRDLTGVPRGVIRPLIPIQDRINQTIFDLLITQSYGSFVVRYVTGMVPPPKTTTLPVTKAEMIAAGEMDPNDPQYASLDPTAIVGYKQVVQVDETGAVIRQDVMLSPRHLMTIQDPNAKVGSLPASPLEPYVSAIEMSVRHLAAIAQVPPQFLMGTIANLSSDALAALSASLDRMVAEFQHSFGDSWEQVFQVVAEIEHLDGQDQYDTMLIWRDMSSRSLSQTVDALGKAVQMLGIPQQAAWAMYPGSNAATVTTWRQMAQDEANNVRDGSSSSLRRSLSPANAGLLNSSQSSSITSSPTPSPAPGGAVTSG